MGKAKIKQLAKAEKKSNSGKNTPPTKSVKTLCQNKVIANKKTGKASVIVGKK